MLPDGDGDLCPEIRKESDARSSLLTARGEEIDRIVGLELGADDYVVKPFSAGEPRRPDARDPSACASDRPPRTDRGRRDHARPSSRTVTKNGAPIELAAKEFDPPHSLIANAGTVLRREEIMDEVWDPHWFRPTKTLDVHSGSSNDVPGDDD